MYHPVNVCLCGV